MDFGKMVTELMKAGYKRAGARAKIAHDVVLAGMKPPMGKGACAQPPHLHKSCGQLAADLPRQTVFNVL